MPLKASGIRQSMHIGIDKQSNFAPADSMCSGICQRVIIYHFERRVIRVDTILIGCTIHADIQHKQVTTL